jgi:hypothetical protein
MELNVPTIAQRKAARRSQIASGAESSTAQGPSLSEHPAQTTQQVSGASEQSPNTVTASPDTSILRSTTDNVPKQNVSTTPSPQISDYPLDKDSLIAIARSMGLELAAPKKIWIKHSYSVTPESKEKFSKYCEVLGIKMQDGLEEALVDWFKKRENEFRAVSEAKQP